MTTDHAGESPKEQEERERQEYKARIQRELAERRANCDHPERFVSATRTLAGTTLYTCDICNKSANSLVELRA